MFHFSNEKILRIFSFAPFTFYRKITALIVCLWRPLSAYLYSRCNNWHSGNTLTKSLENRQKVISRSFQIWIFTLYLKQKSYFELTLARHKKYFMDFISFSIFVSNYKYEPFIRFDLDFLKCRILVLMWLEIN